MKAKNFQQYLEKRLDKAEIAEIEKLAELEMEYLQSLQEDVSNAVANYMAEEKIGFNELVRRLNISPAQASNIQSGRANLTLATIAHIFALLKMRPHLVVNEGFHKREFA
jgi:transcriptional regulator with XRE-family HTH domain